jgi:hypothetical protein
MNKPTLITNHVAEAAVEKYRIVKFGSTDDYVAQAAADTDAPMGVSGELAADLGERVDIVREGIAEVEYGGAVTRGDELTSDADGKAVKLTGSTIKQAVIAGGAAGAHTVTGIATTDELVSVLQADIAADTGTSASGDKVQAINDLTSEFTISAANTIDNATHTDTTGDTLIVTYRRRRRKIGNAEVSGVSGDIGSVLIALGVV